MNIFFIKSIKFMYFWYFSTQFEITLPFKILESPLFQREKKIEKLICCRNLILGRKNYIFPHDLFFFFAIIPLDRDCEKMYMLVYVVHCGLTFNICDMRCRS